MNYLAHFYLASPEDDLMVGNFMGDAVKGSSFAQYPKAVADGIVFHRLIDSYTDRHPQVRKANRLLRPTQRKYSGVVLDVLFDHFLAKHWNEYHTDSLKGFAEHCHGVIDGQRSILPERAERFFGYMKANGILEGYAYPEGIQRVLRGMDSRTSFASNMQAAVHDLRLHQEELEACFRAFFPDLIKTTTQWKEAR